MLGELQQSAASARSALIDDQRKRENEQNNLAEQDEASKGVLC